MNVQPQRQKQETAPPVRRIAGANDRLAAEHDPERALQMHTRYLGLIGMAWASFLIVSILVAAKIFTIGELEFSVAVLSYPFTYIFADIFTEVYGYRQTRRIVWTGLGIVLLVSLLLAGMVAIPPAQSYAGQDAFETIFSAAPLLTLACIAAFFFGEITNSFVLAKMKIATRGRHLWARTTSSTVAGQLIDNLTFFGLAYAMTDIYDSAPFINVALATAAFCAVYEFLMTPVTYRIVAALKRAEGMDVYDRGTNFNPFRIS